MDVINNISFAHTLDKEEVKLSIIGQIVRDADWLDAIGAIGITRAIYYGGGHHEKIYDPAIKPRHNMSREEYRNLANETIINHFDEKLLHLKDMMNTETAKKIANHRQQVMLDFLDEFHAEWDAKMYIVYGNNKCLGKLECFSKAFCLLIIFFIFSTS